MCRFLLVRSKNKIKPETLLKQFALICQKSRAPDGDWQGDGWGIAAKTQSSKFKVQKWDEYKSLKPIWEEVKSFSQFPETDIFAVHARSAGFPDQKGIIEFNQPYIFPDVMLNSFQHPRHDSKKILNQVQDDRITSSNSLVYVFNGMIRGVRLSMPLEGKIGAQKIFSLLKQKMETDSIDGALRQVDELIVSNAKKVEGMNIGLIRNDKFYLLCEYESNADYFRIKYYQDDKITLVCSEPVGSYQWRYMQKSEILVL